MVRGFTLVELLVVISIIGMLMALLLPAINSARETGRQNTCRNHLSNLALAMIQYDGRIQRYPGYINALRTFRGQPYRDPATGTQMPVSWAVEILPDLERKQTYDEWRADITGGSSGGGGGGGGGSGSSGNFIANTKVYLEILTCPSDDTNRQGTPTSYVVNTGQRDAPTSQPANTASASGPATAGIPRDWKANGVFFDYYSDDPLINTNATRVPIVVSRSSDVLDPKDKTIMLTENVDAVDYTFDINTAGGATFPYAEVQVGCIWDGTAPITAAASTGGAPNTIPPEMVPTMDEYRINFNVGKGDGIQYQYCRPSSRHPQGVNVAFVGKNVMFLRENISYFVYAKLMASNDSGIKLAGGTAIPDQSLLRFQISDAELNP